MRDDNTKRKQVPRDTPFYHVSAPEEYDPRAFGVSDEESAEICRLRQLYIEHEYDALLNEREPETGVIAVALKIYQAMSIREMPGGGDHMRVLGYLCSALYILNSIEPERRVDFCTRARVNIGVQIASALKAITTDTLYPLAVVSAAAELAPDPRMGNWTAYATAAEYERDHGLSSGLSVDSINERVFQALIKATAKGKFDTTKMERYIEDTVHFEEFRKSPLYKVFMESLNKVKTQQR